MGRLAIEIGAILNASGFEQGIRHVQKSLANFRSNFGGLIGGAAVAGLSVATKKVIDYGGKLSDLSKQTGVSVSALQEFDYWATQNGKTLDDVVLSLKGLRKARDEALEGNPEKILAFDAAKLDPKMSVEQLFRGLAEKIRTTDFGDDEGVIAEKLMGKAGDSMLSPMKESLADASAEARNLGIIIEDGVVAKLDEVGDAIDRITAQMRGPLASAVAIVASGFSKFIDYISAKGRAAGSLLAIAEGVARGNKALIQEGLKGFKEASMDMMLGPTPKPGEAGFIGPMQGRSKGKLNRVDAGREASRLFQEEIERYNKERDEALFRAMPRQQKLDTLTRQRLEKEAEMERLGPEDKINKARLEAELAKNAAERKSLSPGIFKNDVSEWQRIGSLISAHSPERETAKRQLAVMQSHTQILRGVLGRLQAIDYNTKNGGDGMV